MLNLNTYFDKIYYLNLDKDVERNESILKEFTKWGITNYKRISGVVVDTLPDFLSYRNYINDKTKYILGSYGCCLTHLNAIRDAKEKNYSRILIFEDDIKILQNPHYVLNSSPKNWDLFYFGGLIEKQFRNQIVCAHAYALSSRLYDDILCMAIPSGMEIDNFYAKIIQHMSYNYSIRGKYLIETAEPFNTIIQIEGHSNIKY